MKMIVSPETAAWMLRSGSARLAPDGGLETGAPMEEGGTIPVVVDKYCPTWGAAPSWWRRWFLRERTQRVFLAVKL